MELKAFLQENTVYLDGGMGTLLQAQGLPLGELPERWNLTHSTAVQDVHKAYFDAGSHIVATNTFGANALKFTETELDEIICAAVNNARAAASASKSAQEKWVALDVGPSGKLLKPYGTLEFEEACDVYKEVVRAGVAAGADLVVIETMGDSYELNITDSADEIVALAVVLTIDCVVESQNNS